MSNTQPPFPAHEHDLPPSIHPDVTPPPAQTPVPSGSDQGRTDVAKEQASQLGHETAAASQKVAETTKAETAKVATETKRQTKHLLREAQEQMTEQAGEQQKKVASGLRSVSDELKTMADNSDQGGMGADLVHEAASRTGNIASWLDDRDPGALLDEVRTFARERPGAFIGIAAAAGILAGRLTRSLASESSDEHTTSTPSTSSNSADQRPHLSPPVPNRASSPTHESGRSPVHDAPVCGGFEAPVIPDSPVPPPVEHPQTRRGGSAIGEVPR